ATYRFEKNTHTGTETLLLAGVLADGETILENAAQEPEVNDLIGLLVRMGANIKRTAPRTIVIKGVSKLHGTRFVINPDRNEIITLAIAALLTKGDIYITNARKEGIEAFLAAFAQVGGSYKEEPQGMRFYSLEKELSPSDIRTAPAPHFMTDWQGPWAVLMTQATGVSTIHETVYENRFGYVSELIKMGANIKFFSPSVTNPKELYNFNLTKVAKEKHHAIRITGATQLHNAVVNITDLRAGATLVLAALTARGTSIVFGVEHLDRGYEQFEKRLNALGAKIRRASE
ncbi:MAG: UDP-N-acetylglucosamine 1-carboxyvinyltransferase, partial [Candidatus Levybacteria bacterium]|nr:UDP-N-acetylglucosamine 1-carboxyvinyltransferase [Candidatus Levybacteria bacterium]